MKYLFVWYEVLPNSPYMKSFSVDFFTPNCVLQNDKYALSIEFALLKPQTSQEEFKIGVISLSKRSNFYFGEI